MYNETDTNNDTNANNVNNVNNVNNGTDTNNGTDANNGVEANNRANANNGVDAKKAANTKRNVFDSLQDEIMRSDLTEAEKNRRLSELLKISGREVNLMLVGATGCGKSSTINAMFDMSVAAVGVDVGPETQSVEKYELGNLTIWDSPGLGDGEAADKRHTKEIVRKLMETDKDGNQLIDLVLVVLDASSKDLAVSYDLINETLIPCLGKGERHRILIGLNQSDMAMKGRHWDQEKNAPDPVLKGYLTKKANSVKQRVLDATGVTVEPVCYSAGYTEDDGERQSPYNLSKLLYYILMAVPAEKRLALADKLNKDEDNWAANDEDMDYGGAVRESFFDSLLEGVGEGAEKGAVAGGVVIGLPGMVVGGLVGGILGGLHALVIKPFMD
jgi:predicted GTPase